MNERRSYLGSCHCGRVTFALQTKLASAMECNCSLCRRKGALWHGASDSSLRILAGQEDLVLYQFGTLTAKHYSCRHCSVSPFSRPRLDPSRWVINLRCIDGLDLSSLEIHRFDGENWEESAKAFSVKPG